MDGEGRTRKLECSREKHSYNARKRTFQERKIRSESTNHSSATSVPEDSLDGMMVVGKGCGYAKSRSYDCAVFLHECHSDTALHPRKDETAHKDIAPSEGLQIGLPAYSSISNTSFSSAKSQMSNGDALQKKLQELENELSGKNATIAHLKKELGKGKNEVVDCNSQAVETILTFGLEDDFEVKLNELKNAVKDREKTVNELTRKLDESIKAKALEVEANRGLSCEVNLLNRQLQSMYELVRSKHWDSGIDPKDLAKYKNKVVELEMALAKQQELVKELNFALEAFEKSLESKEKDLKIKTQELVDHKNKSSIEVYQLMDQIENMHKDAKAQAEKHEKMFSESQRKMQDEIVRITEQLEERYQKDLSKALNEYYVNFEKISKIPRDSVDRLLTLCETEKMDFLLLRTEMEEEKKQHEKNISQLREDHETEVRRLSDVHESKLLFLRTQVESLGQQLKERNTTLEVFENELLLYKTNSSVDLLKASSKTDDFSSLKELYNAEIISQKQIHKLEIDVFEEKVKQLSQDILYHAQNEEIHLQEIKSAKAVANTFKEKYEQLLNEWEERNNATIKRVPFEPSLVDVVEIDEIVAKFKQLTVTLKEAEKLHEEKMKHFQKLHEDEITSYQKEVDIFKTKLEQVGEILVKQTELDFGMKELIKNIEFKHTNTLRTLTQSHDSEMKLKEAELTSMEKRYMSEINAIKEKQEKEIWVLKNKMSELEDSRDTVKKEFDEFKSTYNPTEVANFKKNIDEITVQLLKCQGMLACKEEIEEALKARIIELENVIKEKEENCKKELQDILAKYVKTQALLSAKEEIAKELEEKVKESDELLRKSKAETEELDQNCVKLKDLLSNAEDKYQNMFVETEQLHKEFQAMKDQQENAEKTEEKNGESTKTIEVLQKELANKTQEIDSLKQRASEVKLEQSTQTAGDVNPERERTEAIEIERDQLLERNRILQENVNTLNARVDHLSAELANNKGPESDPGMQEHQNMYEDRLPRTFATFGCQVSFLEPSEIRFTLDSVLMNSDCEKLKRKPKRKSHVELEEGKLNKMNSFSRDLLDPVNPLGGVLSELGIAKYKSCMSVKDKKSQEENLLLKILNLDETGLTLNKLLATEKCTSLPECSVRGDQVEVNKQVEKMWIYIETFNKRLVLLQSENNRLLSESAVYKDHIQTLKCEIAEAWTQRCEIEDQLALVRKENAFLVAERDHLQQKNRKVLSLVSEGMPSVMSWIKIHEVVENIVEEVVALNTSFHDLNPSRNIIRSIAEVPKSNSELMVALDNLSLQVEEKTKECDELWTQKKYLEKEMKNLEHLLLHNESNLQIQKRNFERELQHCEHSSLPKKSELSATSNSLDLESESHSSLNLDEERLELLKQDSHETFVETIGKLKEHIQEQYDRQGSRLKEELTGEIEMLRKEISKLHEEIKVKDEALKERSHVEKKDVDESEVESLKLKFQQEMKEMSKEHEMELEKLRSILAEMRKSGNNSLLMHEIETKHAKEMEELRMYFEQKCAQVEKHYSEEIFSQQSQKMSKSSSISETELLNDIYNTDFANALTVKLNKVEVLDNCRKLFENQDESHEERKRKVENFVLEILNTHANEVNELQTKHSQTVRELEDKHIAEMKIVDSELTELRKNLDIEKHHFEVDLKEKIEKIKNGSCENGKKCWLDDSDSENFKKLGFKDMEAKYGRELFLLEETWMDELGECHTDLALNRAEAKEQVERLEQKLKSFGNFREELQKEERKIAIYYKNLNETLLKKYEDEQNRLIKCQAEQMENLIREHQKEIRLLKGKDTGDSLDSCCDDAVKKVELEFRVREKELESELSSMKSTYEDELIELRKCCLDTLQEQVNQAKADAVDSLRNQIRIYLDGHDSEETTPRELIQLGEKFIEKHQEEVCRIKMEYDSLLNASVVVRHELDKCLKQLKNDATCLLTLSEKPEDDIIVLVRKIELEKSSLIEKVQSVEETQKSMEEELKHTKAKLSQLEERRGEVVCEVYGEEVVQPAKVANLSQLKEKARQMIEQCNEPSTMITFLEEICKEGDRLQEDFNRETHDLQLQVAAADKQLRSTREFLEEQATEREVERDEFMREINQLKEALRLRERDNSLHDRISQDSGTRFSGSETYEEETMEALDAQLKETTARLNEEIKSKVELEKDMKTAVDKIWSLREIISDLEGQVANISQREAELQEKVEQLQEEMLERERLSNSLTAELETYKNSGHEELTEHVRHLEEELVILRRVAERSSDEAIFQMKNNLREIEMTLIRKTRELEQLHASSTNISCSSPSEDVSIREHLDATRCPTPDEMHFQEIAQGGLPLEELERINEKLLRHNRAEEVALKTIRDLEMQLKSNRKVLEELQTERDVLLERVDSYLQENSSLKARLDEQRCNAGAMQRQMSVELESQIRRLENDIEKLKEISNQKDKQLRDLSTVLEQTTKSLKNRENEVQNKSREENVIITTLKTDLEHSLEEKSKLEEQLGKMRERLRTNAHLPALVDTMLEEKNAEIDRLEKEVVRLSNKRAASSLIKQNGAADLSNISKSSKKVQFSEPDSFVDFISPIEVDNCTVMRTAFDSYADLKISSHHPSVKPYKYTSTPESLSSIGALHLSPRGDSYASVNWTNHHVSVAPSVNGSFNINNQDLVDLRKELTEKSEKLRKCEDQLSERSAVDSEIDDIRNQLRSAMKVVEDDKQMYKGQFEEMLAMERKLCVEIDEKKQELSEKVLIIDSLKHELSASLTELNKLKSDLCASEAELIKKDEEIRKLRNNNNSFHITIESLKKHSEEKEELQKQLEFERSRLESVLNELKILDEKKVEIEEEFLSLRNEYNENLMAERRAKSKLQTELSEAQIKNSELKETCNIMKAELDGALQEVKKLSKNFTGELHTLKKENEKLKIDYLSLQKELESYLVPKADTETQIGVEMTENGCQTCHDYDLALVPLQKAEPSDETEQFRERIEKLKLEINNWESKMDEKEVKKGEILTFVALIRTLLSCVIDNLDDHFYELQTCRRKMMECSVDDLTDRVQKELVLSAKLDNRLLCSLQTVSDSNVLPFSLDTCEEVPVLECGSGDGSQIIPKEKQNLVNLTVKMCELEANLQENIERNKELTTEISDLRNEREELRKRIEQQQNFITLLERNLSQEKGKLATEKYRYDEDAKIMEFLRINFENGLEKIEQLELDLNAEKQQRLILEKQLKVSESVQKADWETRAVSDLKGQLQSERQKNITLGISLEKERKKCQELKTSLDQEKLKRTSEKDVQRLLGSDLAFLQEQKDSLESQLNNARELLKTRQAEILTLKRKINVQELDIKALTFSNEYQEDKDSDISMMAEKMQDLERELDFYRKQIHTLTEKPEKVVSALLLLKMKNLKICVDQHVQESNDMGEALLQLTQETEQMKSLIKKLEESTEGNQSKVSDDTLVADTKQERKTWMEEMENLRAKLGKSENDYKVLKEDYSEILKQNNLLKLELKKMTRELDVLKDEIAIRNDNINGAIAEDRVIHLFGKYMRSESYRKALAWQKRYLMVVISGYEDSEEETWMKLNKFGIRKAEPKKRKAIRSKKRSFKGVALAIVAVFRMKYLVKRWRHGRIAGVNAMLGRPNEISSNKHGIHRPASSSCITNGPIDPLKYQTHNFVRPRSQPTSNILKTPPSRDPGLRGSPLDARKVSECVERFSYLQKNLGLSGRPP